MAGRAPGNQPDFSGAGSDPAAADILDAAGPVRIGVLAIQGDFDAHARAVSAAGALPVLVRTAEQLESVDGLIIPGGESTTFLKFFELSRAGTDLLRALEAFAGSKPTFGTCAGCILLANRVQNPPQKSLGVLDATVERNAYGRQIDSVIECASTELGELEMVYIRAPKITSVGEGVRVLAKRGGLPVLVRQGHLLAATFHPELSDSTRVHAYFIDMVGRAKRNASASAAGPSN